MTRLLFIIYEIKAANRKENYNFFTVSLGSKSSYVAWLHFCSFYPLNNNKLMRKPQVRVSIAKIDPIFWVSFFYLHISTIWIVAFWSLSYFIRIFYWVFSACLIWITPILGYICIFQKGVWQRLIISWTDENLYNYVPMMTHLLRWYWSKQFGNNWKI